MKNIGQSYAKLMKNYHELTKNLTKSFENQTPDQLGIGYQWVSNTASVKIANCLFRCLWN